MKPKPVRFERETRPNKMKKSTIALLFGTVMVMNAQAAFTVVCDPAFNSATGLACGGSPLAVPPGQRQYVYAVTWTTSAVMDTFQVGWLGAPFSNITVYNSSGTVQAFDYRVTASEEEWASYEPHGTTNTIPLDTLSVLQWRNMTLTGEAGTTYYFAYNSYETEQIAGWVASGTPTSSIDMFSAAIGDGVGPVHIPIPEPAGMALAALGAGACLLRRRTRSA